MRPMLPTARKTAVTPISMVPPIGGWNARDPLAGMPAKDAIYLENWIPRANQLELRKGCVSVGTLPTGSNSQTLMVYNPSAGLHKIFAACTSGIYDVTAIQVGIGHVFDTADVNLEGAATNWQYTNVESAGGSFLFACNGQQNPLLFDGTAFVELSGSSTPPLTGPSDVKTIVGVSLFKGRLICTVRDSLSFWYGGVNAVAGALSEFPLAVLFHKGGYLMATARWTLDSGAGPEDRFVAITSEGEVAIYSGYDPSNANNWSLVGIFELPKPIGRRCFCQLGPDLAVMTENGILSLTKALPTASPSKSAAFSDKISNAYQDYVRKAKHLPGWDMLYLAQDGLLLVSIPDTAGNVFQIVFNVTTGAWTRFIGWNTTAMCQCNGEMYYISKSVCFHAFSGQTDNGAAISVKSRSAFLKLSTQARLKFVKLIKLNITANAAVSFKLGIDTDYELAMLNQGAVTLGNTDNALWDVALWDVARWDLDAVQAKWRSVSHKPGMALSFRFTAQLKQVNLTWNATDLIVEAGGLL